MELNFWWQEKQKINKNNIRETQDACRKLKESDVTKNDCKD